MRETVKGIMQLLRRIIYGEKLNEIKQFKNLRSVTCSSGEMEIHMRNKLLEGGKDNVM